MGKKKSVRPVLIGVQFFGFAEHVLSGIPKWQQKAAAVREMYASCSTSADVGHQQRILQQLEERKRARAAGNGQERIRGLASSSSAVTSGISFCFALYCTILTMEDRCGNCKAREAESA